MTFRLVIDPIRCDAFDYCEEVAPEFLHLDEWGYPVVERLLDDTIAKARSRKAIAALEEPPR